MKPCFLFAVCLLICTTRCELTAIESPAQAEPVPIEQSVAPLSVEQAPEAERNLKDDRKLQGRRRGAAATPRIPIEMDFGIYVEDETQNLKDKFPPRKHKYDPLIHRYEQLTRAFNLMADEDELLMSEIGAAGTRLDIPLHPIALMHMAGLRQPLEARKLRSGAQIHRLKTTNHGSNKKKQPRASKERILAARSASKRSHKRGKIQHKRHHQHRTIRQRSRRLSRTITSNQISMFDPRIMMGQNKSGGEGIAVAEATPQLFDAGVTIHNYGPAPATHPTFFDALDQDSKPQYLEANITIPPPRLLQAKPILQTQKNDK